MSEQELPMEWLRNQIESTRVEVADWPWRKEMNNELPKVGEVWGVPSDPKIWQLVVEIISPSSFEVCSFGWCKVVTQTDWHAWVARVKAERIFPPTQVTTGPWPQQNWTQQT